MEIWNYTENNTPDLYSPPISGPSSRPSRSLQKHEEVDIQNRDGDRRNSTHHYGLVQSMLLMGSIFVYRMPSLQNHVHTKTTMHFVHGKHKRVSTVSSKGCLNLCRYQWFAKVQNTLCQQAVLLKVWHARKGFSPVHSVSRQVIQCIPSTKAKAAWTLLEVSVLLKYILFLYVDRLYYWKYDVQERCL